MIQISEQAYARLRDLAERCPTAERERLLMAKLAVGGREFKDSGEFLAATRVRDRVLAEAELEVGHA